jgi:hypothetical protein
MRSITAMVGKIPLFPPLPKGDEKGIFFAAFACYVTNDFLSPAL